MSRLIISVAAAGFCLLNAAARATPYYVDEASGNDAYDGLAAAWDGTHGPKRTIQAGIDVATNGDEVVIAPGTYTGDGNRDLDFAHGLLFGQTRAITVRSTNPEDPAVVAATVIDCQGTSAAPHRGFRFHSGEGPASTVAGVTITNGYGRSIEVVGGRPMFVGGGAVLCTRASATISHLALTRNVASVGGAIYCVDSAAPTIAYCSITDNTASGGGGIACFSSAVIQNCTIAQNSAENGGFLPRFASQSSDDDEAIIAAADLRLFGIGGGIYCSGGSPTIAYCQITANVANGAGGGIACARGAPVINNCLVADNRVIGKPTFAEGEGGGIVVSANGGRISDCTIVGNSVESSGSPSGLGGGVVCDRSNLPYTASVVNSIVWANSAAQGPELALRESAGAAVSWSDVRGGAGAVYREARSTLNWGDGNIDADPLLVDPARGDYHLKATSPCVNAGDPNGDHIGQTDIDGEPRVAYGRVDIGADEYNYRGGFDVDRDMDVDVTDFGFLRACFSGPNQPPPNVSLCTPLDADADGDVDPSDFAAFTACFNGPNRPPTCN